MPASEVKIEYSNLKAIQSATGEQYDKVQALLQRIIDQIDVLKADKWVGENADQFYNKMDNDLNLALGRLLTGLSRMDETIDGIMRVFEAAEDEAQSIFPTS